jgi:hypothetical protein
VTRFGISAAVPLAISVFVDVPCQPPHKIASVLPDKTGQPSAERILVEVHGPAGASPQDASVVWERTYLLLAAGFAKN